MSYNHFNIGCNIATCNTWTFRTFMFYFSSVWALYEVKVSPNSFCPCYYKVARERDQFSQAWPCSALQKTLHIICGVTHGKQGHLGFFSHISFLDHFQHSETPSVTCTSCILNIGICAFLLLRIELITDWAEDAVRA